MSVYLVQHGQSLSKEQDPERGLSSEGIATVEHTALVAAQKGLQVEHIIHSGKRRAQQTAELFARALQQTGGSSQAEGLNPMDAVEPYAANIRSSDQIMLVGHLPFMSRLAGYLVTGSADKPVFRFRNGAVLCLEPDEAGGWIISDVIIVS